MEAWYSTAVDLEESLSGALDSDVHIFVADVFKSFDTVDRGILDCVLSLLGLPGWFRHAYFEYHARVRLRFKRCRQLESFQGIKRQLYADNLKCVSSSDDDLFEANLVY